MRENDGRASICLNPNQDGKSWAICEVLMIMGVGSSHLHSEAHWVYLVPEWKARQLRGIHQVAPLCELVLPQNLTLRGPPPARVWRKWGSSANGRRCTGQHGAGAAHLRAVAATASELSCAPWKYVGCID